jgi:hypothetical protein
MSDQLVREVDDDAEVSKRRRLEQKRKLGIAKDVVGLSDKGVTFGFSIARFATKTGFGIASACIGKPAELVERAAGPNLLSKGLKGVNGVVAFAQTVTHGCQDLAESITHVSLDATQAGLTIAGAEENALLRSLTSEEVAEAVTKVQEMVQRYTDDMVDVPPQALLSGASAWGALQHGARAVRDEEGEAAALPEHTERWMRFAAATMGTAWLAGLVEGFSTSALARANAVREQGGGPGETALACAGVEGHLEVIAFEERAAEVYAPGYMVAVDHDHNCVVVALRGTSSLSDALTDLICEPVPLELGGFEGLAHGGMLRAAKHLDPVLVTVIDEGLSRLTSQTSQRVIICGHSLGAGVAALLAALWRDRAYLPGVSIQCIAFACPQVLDKSLAYAQSNHTMSVIVGDDMVPRFSLATARDLQAAILCLTNPESKGFDSNLSTQAVLEAHVRGDSERLADAYATVRPAVCTSPGRLFPAGRLIHLLPDREPLEKSAECFDEMIVASDMGKSHMPQRYLHAVQNAAAICSYK